jgi:hypothetical protein
MVGVVETFRIDVILDSPDEKTVETATPSMSKSLISESLSHGVGTLTGVSCMGYVAVVDETIVVVARRVVSYNVDEGSRPMPMGTSVCILMPVLVCDFGVTTAVWAIAVLSNVLDWELAASN